MRCSAEVIKHSVSFAGVAIITMRVRMPRYVLAEFNTHRDFSRNSRSSRAVPFKKIIREILEDPYIPLKFTSNKSGMQGGPPLEGEEHDKAVGAYMEACELACKQAEVLHGLGVHKQHVNRLVEPYMWHTVVVTSTRRSNFYAQRRDDAADPGIREAADCMFEAERLSKPLYVDYGRWHLPFVTDDDIDTFGEMECVKISVARSARVSYFTFTDDGTPAHLNPIEDIRLFNKLKAGMHWSPFEHQATPMWDPYAGSGNFNGWEQYRKRFADERR